MLQTGTKAPNFSLSDQNGQVHTLEEYKGKKVILYFYPKDNTPGCTTQACGFAELYPQFQEKGTVILGVSKDSVASHKKFEEKKQSSLYAIVRPRSFLHTGIRCMAREEKLWEGQHGGGADNVPYR